MALIFKQIASRFPDLGQRIMRARSSELPEEYIKRTVVTSLYAALGLCFIAYMFTSSFSVFLVFPFFFAIIAFYFYHLIDFKIRKLEREINKELVFAGRFLIIELQSGIPLFKAFENMMHNYEFVGLYFAEITEKVSMGTSMEDAIGEVAENNPSSNLRKILWQVLNSMKTGSDVAHSLSSVVDQLVREQDIQVKEYGRKLNPLAMFYMMIAIIVPTLGVMMIVVLATFLGFSLSLTMLIAFAIVIGFFQILFLGIIKSNRPPVDI